MPDYQSAIREIRNAKDALGHGSEKKDVVIAPYLSHHYVYVDGQQGVPFESREEAWKWAETQGTPRMAGNMKASYDYGQKKLVWEKPA